MNLNPKQVAANNYNPIAVLNLSGNSTTLSPGIPITFDGTQSYDPDNTNIIAYNWWYVDGVVQSQGSTADKKIFSYTFTLPAGVNSKTFQIKLTVRDNEYITASKTITVTVTLSGRTEYYLTDHLGSIRTTIDQNGAVIGFDDYDPFGNVLPGRSYNAGTPNDLYKFTGHERDQEGGLNLDYMLARNYDPEIGRFYSVDPMHSKRSWLSPYNYVQNNPLIRIDPTGMVDDYIFNENGDYVTKIENDQPDKVVQQNQTTGETMAIFQFTDPINDPSKINQNTKLVVVSDSDISATVNDSGVYSENAKSSPLTYAFVESRGTNASNDRGNARLDFQTNKVIINGVKQEINIGKDFTLYGTNNSAGSFVHNGENYGNFLWGAATKALGIPNFMVKIGSNVDALRNHRELDSIDDQLSIQAGRAQNVKVNN